MCGHREKIGVCKSGREPSPETGPCQTLILDFPSTGTVKKENYVIFGPICVILLWQSETKTLQIRKKNSKKNLHLSVTQI